MVKLKDFRHYKVGIKMHGKYPAAYIKRRKERRYHVKMSNFKKMTMGMEKKGMGKDEAGAIAYKAGEKKYGKKAMTRKSVFGKKKSMKEAK